jgi:two-component system uhpT operon response regulator UhpA
MDRLSQLVLQLHRGSRDWPAAAFAPRAFELLAVLIPYDACLWGSVGIDAVPGAPLDLRGLYSQGLSPQELALSLAGQGPPPELMAHALEPLAARRVELRLWRRCATPGPDESAQEALQFVMPHLVESQRENRLSRAQDSQAGPPVRRSHVLCDVDGVLQQVDEHGLALLRSEWPRWCAARLPEPLTDAIAAAAVSAAATAPGAQNVPPYHGRQVTVLMTRSGESMLLEVRRRAAVDRLSTRQRDIATLYAEGHTGPQIATRLGLSSSTVNNHLGVIFKKLAVSNKVQLLHAMKLRGAAG